MSTAAGVLAVDGGNSKAEALLVARDGRLLAAARSSTVSHQQVGLDGATAGIRRLAARLATDAAIPGGAPVADVGSYCLAGADFAAEVVRLRRRIEGLALTGRTVVRNDTAAALRAGAVRGRGVAVICGQGVNAYAVGPSGRTARFDALGDISGDWGGGTSVGLAGLAAAVRAADGRGPRTSLRTLVPAHFGLRSTTALVRGLYRERVPGARVAELSPVVFAAAAAGDAVAAGIVDRLAEELATMALALLRRTGQVRLDPDVVLAGGVLQAGHPDLIASIERRILGTVKRARVRVLRAPPVLGAALLGLEDLGLAGDELAAADARLRAALDGVSFAPA